MPTSISLTIISPRKLGVFTFLTFFMTLAMMNWERSCQGCDSFQADFKLTASNAAVLQMPKNILPNIALSHLTGIESLSSFKVSINFCISLVEKTLLNVGRGT